MTPLSHIYAHLPFHCLIDGKPDTALLVPLLKYSPERLPLLWHVTSIALFPSTVSYCGTVSYAQLMLRTDSCTQPHSNVYKLVTFGLPWNNNLLSPPTITSQAHICKTWTQFPSSAKSQSDISCKLPNTSQQYPNPFWEYLEHSVKSILLVNY